MLDLDVRWQVLVRQILAFYLPPCRVFAFGSRVQGRARKFSDLDLAVDAGAALEHTTMAKLQQALCVSDLPIKVDVIDRRAVAANFASVIAADWELFWEKTES
jgi:predicted nucleotidyltransferase